jgi:hypothetical protein
MKLRLWSIDLPDSSYRAKKMLPFWGYLVEILRRDVANEVVYEKYIRLAGLDLATLCPVGLRFVLTDFLQELSVEAMIAGSLLALLLDLILRTGLIYRRPFGAG